MNNTFYQDTKDYFSKLPPEGSLEYEKSIAKYSAHCDKADRLEVLVYMTTHDTEWAYESFYVLCTFYRRNKDFTFMNALIQEHPEFSNHLTYNHILIQYMVHSESFYDYESLLDMAFEDAKRLDNNAGFQQAFCNAFATICEQCNHDDRKYIVSRWYEQALSRINRAISLDPTYAKYYSTKARILSFNGKYMEAYQLLNMAISLEVSSRPDYSLTIMTYQNYKLAISIQQQREEFCKELLRLQNMLGSFTKNSCLTVKKNDNKFFSKLAVYEGEKPYVFISYAHSDSDQVYPLIKELQNAGIRIWFDHGIVVGEEWPEEIGRHLTNCQIAIIMLSFHSVLSANVRREITMAVNERKKIIAIMIDSVDLTPGMQLQLGLCQMLSMQQLSKEKIIEQLCSVLKKEGNVYENEQKI